MNWWYQYPTKRSRFRATIKVRAKTYGEAISKAGERMDVLWENGNWSVSSCVAQEAAPGAGGPDWWWTFEIDWAGPLVTSFPAATVEY